MLKFLRNLFRKETGYYFIHIPKTAGTSFINILDAQTSVGEIFPCQLWREVSQEIVDKKQKYKLLRGHFGGGSYNILGHKNAHLLTILRHPQSLSISTYHFIKRETNTAVHDLVAGKNLSLEEFLEDPRTSQKINNRMVRHLSFDLQEDPEAQELFLSEQSIKVVNQWMKPGKKLSNHERYLRAQKRLEDCSWIGIQENFQKSMQLFAYTFNLPPVLEVPYLNAFKPDQNISQKSLDLIAEQNKFDLKLYEFALNEFDKKFQLMCKDLESLRSSESQSLNELINLNYLSKAQVPIKGSIDYSFSQELLGSGWHRRELAMPDETYFRWSSHPEAYMDFWLQPKDYKLSIRFINAISENCLNQLELWLNDQKINHQYDTNTGVVRVLKAEIPAHLIKQNVLRIVFKINQLKKHSEAFGSDDHRNLGIAVNWVKIQ